MSTIFEQKVNALNDISPTMCAVKWYYSSIWLNTGYTASCCRCESHQIDSNQIKEHPIRMFNTDKKIQVRKNLLAGKIDSDCNYCNHLSKIDSEMIIDRQRLSSKYSIDEIQECKTLYAESTDVPVKRLELAFDSLCDFACAYCNPRFSTSWQSDIKSFGRYKNLSQESSDAYKDTGADSHPFGIKNEANPFFDAFWKILDTDLRHTLHELRITGGEPMMSPHFWKLIDKIKAEDFNQMVLSINTNLGNNKNNVDKLIDLADHHHKLHIYTSNESTGKISEYVRDGINYSAWRSNLELLVNSKAERVVVSTTFCVLTIFDFCNFVDDMMSIKLNENNKIKLEISFNDLVTPTFLGLAILPQHMLDKITRDVSGKFYQYESTFSITERLNFLQFIAFLQNLKENNSAEFAIRRQDFKQFIGQYDERRSKSFTDTYSQYPELLDWVNNIK